MRRSYLLAIVLGLGAVLSCASKPPAPAEPAEAWGDFGDGVAETLDPEAHAAGSLDGDAGVPWSTDEPMRRPFRACDGGLLADGEAAPMRLPRLVHATPPVYSREAFTQGVGGVALVRCVFDLDGSVSECTLVKGLPHMNDEILASVGSWKYTPVLYCGRPQRVELVIPIRISPPRVPARAQGR